MISCFLIYLVCWVVLTPLTFLILRSTQLKSRLFFYLPISLLIYVTTGFLNFWILTVPLICTEVALGIDSSPKLKNRTDLQILLLVLASMSHMAVFVLFEMLDPVQMNQDLFQWFTSIDEFWANLSSQVPTESTTNTWLKLSWYEYIGYFGSIYFVSLILGVFACFWKTNVIRKFKVPDLFFWITVLSFALGFLKWDRAFELMGWTDALLAEFASTQIYFKNIAMSLSALYFFQGLSVSSYFMEKFKIARFWQNLWYILIILNLPMILVIVGLVDFLFEFRSFKETK